MASSVLSMVAKRTFLLLIAPFLYLTDISSHFVSFTQNICEWLICSRPARTTFDVQELHEGALNTPYRLCEAHKKRSSLSTHR